MPHFVPVAAAGAGILAAFLFAVLVAGYLVIWAIWHFGFRGRDEEGRRIDKRSTEVRNDEPPDR